MDAMVYSEVIEITANAASILTAVIAVWAFLYFQVGKLRQRWRLEAYLRDQQTGSRDGGQRTILHLVARLGMSEAEIIDAAFRSKVIDRKVSQDDEGKADRLFLVYRTRR